MLVRLALSTFTPTVDESVQSEAPRASVKPVGAEPYLLMVPRAEVAAAVPVPLVVPPADSMVRLMELSTVPVTVSVPDAGRCRSHRGRQESDCCCHDDLLHWMHLLKI